MLTPLVLTTLPIGKSKDRASHARLGITRRRNHGGRATAVAFSHRYVLLIGSAHHLTRSNRVGLGFSFDPAHARCIGNSVTFSHKMVETDQKLSHHGDQGNSVGFASGPQALVEWAQHRILARGDEGGHVKRLPRQRPTAKDMPRGGGGTGVAIPRRDASQGGNPPPVESSQFG